MKKPRVILGFFMPVITRDRQTASSRPPPQRRLIINVFSWPVIWVSSFNAVSA